MLDWLMGMTDELKGGAIIGIATVLMMHLNGRVTGISGILEGALRPQKGDWIWRLTFLSGLFFGGLLMHFKNPQGFLDTTSNSPIVLVLAGFLVGFGSLMGSGCTSGHGVCGLSRFSKRSFIAICLFMASGALTVWLKSL